MFNFALPARRTTIRKTTCSSCRPQVERLEDRLVMTIPPNGTILITNQHSFDNNSSTVRVDSSRPLGGGLG